MSCDLGMDLVEGLVDLGDGFEGERVPLLLVCQCERGGVALRRELQLYVGVQLSQLAAFE